MSKKAKFICYIAIASLILKFFYPFLTSKLLIIKNYFNRTKALIPVKFQLIILAYFIVTFVCEYLKCQKVKSTKNKKANADIDSILKKIQSL